MILVDLDYESIEYRLMARLADKIKGVQLIALELNAKELDEKLKAIVVSDSLDTRLLHICSNDLPTPPAERQLRCLFPGCKKERTKSGYCSPNHMQLHQLQKRGKR